MWQVNFHLSAIINLVFFFFFYPKPKNKLKFSRVHLTPKGGSFRMTPGYFAKVMFCCIIPREAKFKRRMSKTKLIVERVEKFLFQPFCRNRVTILTEFNCILTSVNKIQIGIRGRLNPRTGYLINNFSLFFLSPHILFPRKINK